MEINLNHLHPSACARMPTVSYLCSSRAASEVPGHKEVDNGPTDSLCGQDQSQRPPEAQHLPYGRIALCGETEVKAHSGPEHSLKSKLGFLCQSTALHYAE